MLQQWTSSRCRTSSNKPDSRTKRRAPIALRHEVYDTHSSADALGNSRRSHGLVRWAYCMVHTLTHHTLLTGTGKLHSSRSHQRCSQEAHQYQNALGLLVKTEADHDKAPGSYKHARL